MLKIKKIISFNLAILLLLSMTVISSAASQSWPLVKKGSSGDCVYALQYLLKYHNHTTIGVDGYFGSNTESIVEDFQSANGLYNDGIVGKNTWLKLIRTVRSGDNNYAVRAVQHLLKNKHGYTISIDGAFGSGTKSIVMAFQTANGLSPDGIVGNNTWLTLLNDKIDNFWDQRRNSWTNPIHRYDSYHHVSSGSFGAARSGGRAHAGLDFISSVGTRVVAMTSGQVINVYPFYLDSKAIEVKNDDGTVIRYCELSPSVAVGDRVQQGDLIGKVVMLKDSSMLHLEIYRGTSSGSLTQSNNSTYHYVSYKNYKRRADLQDPSYATNLNKYYN